MKALSKYLIPEILSNPINRDLLLIFIVGMLAAITLVTGFIIILNQV